MRRVRSGYIAAEEDPIILFNGQSIAHHTDLMLRCTDALSIFVAVVDCARAHADNNWVTTGQSVPLLQSALVAHSSLTCNVHTKFVEAPAAMQSK